MTVPTPIPPADQVDELTPVSHLDEAGAQTRAVLALKGVEYAGLTLFTVLLPRLMGPERYGAFAAVLGAVGLLTMLAGIGAQATLGRFVPEFVAAGRLDRVRQLFTQVFLARVLTAAVLAGVLVLGLPYLLPEAGGTVAIAAGATVLVGAASLACFQLLYGLNQLARWLVRDALVRPVLVALLVVGGGIAFLDRAALALLTAELLFLALGLAWARRYFSREPWEGGRADLFTHLRFGLYFFGANLLLMAVWRGGEVTVLILSDARAEIAYFSIANAVAMAFGALIGQLASMLVPRIASFHVTGEGRQAEAWLGHSLKYLTIGTFVFVLVVDGVGEAAVRLILGAAYLPVVVNLKVLALGLLPVALVRTAVNQALVHKRPGWALAVAGGGLVGFVILAVTLVPRWGSLGASVSVAGAVAVAGLVAYRQAALGGVLSVARFWRVVLPGIAVLLLAALPGVPPLATASGGLVLYAALLWAARALTVEEIRRLARAVTSRE
jgi:O-antigen/teichoic acid export membrane protein